MLGLVLVHVTHGQSLRQTVNSQRRCARAEPRTPARYVYIVQRRRREGRGTECSHIIIVSGDFGDVRCDNDCAGFLFCSMRFSILFYRWNVIDVSFSSVSSFCYFHPRLPSLYVLDVISLSAYPLVARVARVRTLSIITNF